MRAVKNRFRRGISPAITAIILILAAVGAGVLVYVFVTPMLHPTVVKLDVMDIQARCSADGKTLVITIDVRNSGTVPVNITGITVKKGGTALTLTWTPTLPLTMASNSETTLSGSGTLTTALHDGDQLTVTVTYVGPNGVQKSVPAIATVHMVS